MRYALTLAAACLTAAAAHAADVPPVHACDTLTQHPADPDKITAGAEKKDMNLDAAAAACRDALKTYPDEARFHYQLARALYYRGKPADIQPALTALGEASSRGYRQATFVLGYIYTLGQHGIAKDMCRAGHLWKRSLDQGHPWTRFYIANHQLKGDFANCSVSFSDADAKRAALSFIATGTDDTGGEREAELKALLAK